MKRLILVMLLMLPAVAGCTKRYYKCDCPKDGDGLRCACCAKFCP
jgi:hypothetical protein